MKKIKFAEKEIVDLYENKNLSTFQIADKVGCCQATIWKRLKEFKIKPRLPGIKRVNLSKNKLSFLYINKRLSTWKIEKELNIPRSTIHRKLKEYNINVRSLSEANNKYKKINFSNNLIEKAYLIGFRIGDLRVRKQYKNSKTISVGCSSTIPEQITLIKKLFIKYGGVWIKKSKDKRIIYTEAYLNESFGFLLTKNLPNWVLNCKKHFLSFLAGFIDAEGHIGVYRNMAKLTIGNYDSNILFNIYKKLNDYGIKCNSPNSDNRKGKCNSEGYKYNNNYWQLGIYRKEDLLNIFNLLKPYIKHKNKIKDLNRAIENIIQRNKK